MFIIQILNRGKVYAPEDGTGTGAGGSGGGDDTAAGAGGDDTSAGAGGDDTLSGAGGDDTSAGSGGDDTAAGGKNDTLAAGGGKPDDKSSTKGAWPEDWRERLAGDDDKALEQLKRLGSPSDLFKSNQELRKKLSTAKVPDELPEDATDEDVAEWRKRNGIPEKPEGYLENTPDGVVFGEEDEAALAGFLSKMHEGNVPPDMVNKALEWYQEFNQQEVDAQILADKEFRAGAEDEMREEWGAEYRTNLNTISNFLDSAPEGVKDNLMDARLADGTLFGDNPKAMAWLLNLSNEINPASVITPSTGQDVATSIQEELDEISETRRTNPKKYWADEKMQARERELFTAQEKMQKRAG